MSPALRAAVEGALGTQVTSASRVSGGDINDAYRLELSEGRVAFVKANGHADPAMFPAEARGLGWLAGSGTLRVPGVLAVGQAPAFLALEWLEPVPRARGYDEALGRGLARLHRTGTPTFGLDHDNFIGSLPQVNAARATWADFYRDCRLVPQLRRAAEAGLAPDGMRAGFERLFAQMEAAVGPPEPPARLHGDLWSGNLHTDERGAPCLIDPAVYGGHREMDLAMMQLFGGFSERTFAAYAEAHPLADGHEERVALYQLYPLLVHVNLFGGGYVGAVERALGRSA